MWFQNYKQGVEMKKIAILVLLVATIFGCSNNKLKKQMPAEQKLQIAKTFIEKNKHHKAIPYLQQIAFERNSGYTTEAQMLLAESYFAQNKFTEARFEYEELIRLFSDYSRVGEAYFNIGVCYFEESLASHYTQEETDLAIDAFQTFLSKFPFSKQKKEAIEYIKMCNQKLLEKRYFNGYAYYKMFDYSAALMYFDEIIELGNNDELDLNSLYYSAKIYAERKDQKNLNSTFERLQARYPESDQVAKINKLIK